MASSTRMNVAFLLNSSQPEDNDDDVLLERSDVVEATRGIQTTVFLLDKQSNRDESDSSSESDEENDNDDIDDDDLYLPRFSPFESVQCQNAPDSDLSWNPSWQPPTLATTSLEPPLLAAQYSLSQRQLVWSPEIGDMQVTRPAIERAHKRELRDADQPVDILDVFLEFFPTTLVAKWAEYTYKRWQIRQNSKPTSYRRRKPHGPPTYPELLIFFAILLYLSIHREHEIKAYWARNSSLPNHSIVRWMSRDRFRWLYRNFCVWDPADPPVSIWDRTKEWSQHLIQKSLSLWKPGFYIAVDESMVRFQGRCFDKTLMKSKPIPVGLKLFLVAERGFVCGFAPYTRNGIEMPPLQYSPEENGMVLSETRAVVAHLALSLLQHLPPSSLTNSFQLHVFCDNLFTSVELVEYLYHRKILYTGTIRGGTYGGLDNRFNLLKTHDDSKKRFPWGTIFTGRATRKTPRNRQTSSDMQTPELAHSNQIAWKDSQTVVFLSSAYTGLEEPIVTKRKRPSAGATHSRTSRLPFGDNGETDLPVPIVAAAYNKKMNSVDIADQLRADAAHNRRIRRGAAQALMYDFLLGTTVTNAFLYAREIQRSSDDETSVLSQSQFRQLLYSRVTEKFGQNSVPKWATENTSTASLSQPSHHLVRSGKRRYCMVCSKPFQERVLGHRMRQKLWTRTRFECAVCGKAFCSKEQSGRDCFAIGHRTAE